MGEKERTGEEKRRKEKVFNEKGKKIKIAHQDSFVKTLYTKLQFLFLMFTINYFKSLNRFDAQL